MNSLESLQEREKELPPRHINDIIHRNSILVYFNDP